MRTGWPVKFAKRRSIRPPMRALIVRIAVSGSSTRPTACRAWTGEPRLLEPKADEVRWFDLEDLPENVVHHERFVLDGMVAGRLPVITAYGF